MYQLPSASFYLIFAVFASFLLQSHADEVTCYAPDGITVAPNDSYVPCNKLGITQQGVYSSCCLLDGDPDARDLCAESGLCIRGGIVRREFCTDKQWKSPACVKVCTGSAVGGSINGTVQLTPCTDGTFCCGNNNLTCCGTQYAVTVATQVSVVVVQTETATPTPSGVPGVAAVAGLGIGLGVVMLVATGIIICLRRKNTALKLNNANLRNSIIQQEPSLPNVSGMRPMSYLPGSGTTTVVAPSSHVPSMQEFAAFKTYYGNIMAQQSAMEAANNPQRYSELDASTMAAARHLSRLSMQQPMGFEQIREVPMEHEMQREPMTPPPNGPPPGAPTQGGQGGQIYLNGLESWKP